MENKHIQNSRNENNKKNDTTKKIGKIHIQENEYIKNQNNFYDQEDIQGNVHYESTHKEGYAHKPEELSEHQHIGKSEKSSVNQYTYKSGESSVNQHIHKSGESSVNQHTHKSGEASVYQHTHTHVDTNGNVYTHTHTHSPQIVKNELNRIARIIGHMKSIKIMIESGRDCSEVLIQLAAVDAAVKSLSRVILKEHMSTCIVDAIKTGDEEAIEALNDAIDKFMK